MLRLTKRIDGEVVENHDNDTTIGMIKVNPNVKKWRNGHRACMEKLAAYEDTGLTPEEVAGLKENYIGPFIKCKEHQNFDAALKWFEEELRDGRCSPTCLQCDASEIALWCLRMVKTMHEKEDITNGGKRTGKNH